MLGRVLLGLANCCILRLWKCLKGSARLGQLLHPAVSQAPPRLGFGYRPGSADIDHCKEIESFQKDIPPHLTVGRTKLVGLENHW